MLSKGGGKGSFGDRFHKHKLEVVFCEVSGSDAQLYIALQTPLLCSLILLASHSRMTVLKYGRSRWVH